MSIRNFKGFATELLIPGLLIVSGFGLSTIDFFVDSPKRTLSPSLFPLNQRVIYNTNGITGDGDAATLIGMLDPSTSFSATGITSTVGGTDTETMENFDDELYDTAQDDPMKPYRYGSYYFETLDATNDQYKIVTFANTTSQESTIAFSQFMYEAVLRYSVDSSFQFTMVNDPMPIVQIYKDREKGGNGMFLGFVLAIAFALIPTAIIGFLINEKVN